MKKIIIVFLILLPFSNFTFLAAQRKEISLNGIWQIAKTNIKSDIPNEFKSNVIVPGLVDMAIPAIDTLPTFSDKKLDLTVAATSSVSNAKSLEKIETNESWYYNDAVYWYKKKISINVKNSDVVILKINKAMYHTRVFVNGKMAGENYYNFSPTYVNIKPFLNKKSAENEIIISVGCRNNLPNTIVRGDDFEKFYFVPGIYDDVKLILTGSSFISNVQIVPDIVNKQVRVVALINKSKEKTPTKLIYSVRESISKKVVATGTKNVVDFKIDIPDCKLWSPETPFLYDLELSTGTDNLVTRFGMRSFITSTGKVLLNGKPYYLRGTNICLFRFFEDSERGNLPWDYKWVTDLHKSFKDMHWNSYRPTLGFPPERWYEIADSLGFLIQDEYPIWKGHKGKSDGLTSDLLANEFSSWMKERWNHPSVVIWDAQNESVYDSTAIAINKVRTLDLSNRPWDNGWASPASQSDVMETHPYLLYPTYAKLKEGKNIDFPNGLLNYLFKEEKNASGPNFASNKPRTNNPIINNEYGWLWLNRDGSTTVLTDVIYKNLFPEANTPQKRLEVFAKILGMETEFWRSSRKFAGLMNFCALTYSHPKPPRGLTCDNFQDVKNLKYEPYFYQYVRQAFSPVGIMINFWDEKVIAGAELKIPINIINDTYNDWNGVIKLSLFNLENKSVIQSINANVKSLSKEVDITTLKIPNLKGKYKLEAEIVVDAEFVKSIREFVVE
ncbi:MAG: glycoside hydrolase family 2 TIM barrel-domain containing protein [Bacteroidota bacterium]|nr:glycoside hydrolase family 2 TIM barrel-domain containing protein [Bacteroidota bacterium]